MIRLNDNPRLNFDNPRQQAKTAKRCGHNHRCGFGSSLFLALILPRPRPMCQQPEMTRYLRGIKLEKKETRRPPNPQVERCRKGPLCAFARFHRPVPPRIPLQVPLFGILHRSPEPSQRVLLHKGKLHPARPISQLCLRRETGLNIGSRRCWWRLSWF
jgi:hypothetical protein